MRKLVILSPSNIEYVKNYAKLLNKTFSFALRRIIEEHQKNEKRLHPDCDSVR